MKQNNSKLRVIGYARTSGEKQRDNTSIPRQKSDIEKFIATNRWKFIRHYVDESLSGSKIEGRDDFKRMMKDAANGQFDVIVIYDISRFARDGSDIIRESYFLKKHFGIHVIDTKGFDTRKPRNTLLNFVFAGVAEDERLRIMDRTINARIHNAENGLPWSPKPPFGRAFKRSDKHSGEWYLTEDGKKLYALLKRYVNGEALRHLAKEYGFLSAQTITRKVRESQLSAGTYIAKFHSPEIGIENLLVQIPDFPAVISPELETRVIDRMGHNQKCNKQLKRKYLLSGFLICAHCGKSLIAQTCNSRVYYRHSNFYADERKKCPYYRSIRGDLLEGHVLDYLYNFFLDEPAYNKAIQAALPSGDDRKALETDIKRVNSQLAKVNKNISNLANAIADGFDRSLLRDKQDELKMRKQALKNRYDELNQTLLTMPNPEVIKQDSKILRWKLMNKHWGRNWRKIPYDDVRKFLHFLFSDNPRIKGYGVFVGKQNDKWHITFKGCATFCQDVVDGQPEVSSRFTQEEIGLLTTKLEEIRIARASWEENLKEAEELKNDIESIKKLDEEIVKCNKEIRRLEKEMKNLREPYHELKPNKDYNQKMQ